MKKNILRKHNFVAEVTFKRLDMVLEEEEKIFPIPKMETLEISENVVLLKILTVVTT